MNPYNISTPNEKFKRTNNIPLKQKKAADYFQTVTQQKDYQVIYKNHRFYSGKVNSPNIFQLTNLRNY